MDVEEFLGVVVENNGCMQLVVEELYMIVDDMLGEVISVFVVFEQVLVNVQIVVLVFEELFVFIEEISCQVESIIGIVCEVVLVVWIINDWIGGFV